jgi:hypothetical protein
LDLLSSEIRNNPVLAIISNYLGGLGGIDVGGGEMRVREGAGGFSKILLISKLQWRVKTPCVLSEL